MGERPVQAREVRLPEFAKLAPDFNGRSPDPVVAENWVTEMEKSFKAFNVSEAMKMLLAKFQLQTTTNDWWVNEKASQQAEVNWTGFKDLFYKKVLPPVNKGCNAKLIMGFEAGKPVCSGLRGGV